MTKFTVSFEHDGKGNITCEARATEFSNDGLEQTYAGQAIALIECIGKATTDEVKEFCLKHNKSFQETVRTRNQ